MQRRHHAGTAPTPTAGVREGLLQLPCSAAAEDGLPALNAVRTGFGDRVRVGDQVRSLDRAAPSSALPYRSQRVSVDEPAVRPVRTVELENEYLSAVFLPGLGGRLWSLVDKASGSELAPHPDEIRLVTDGVRGAWFPGGVEWNLGAAGHWPLTCSPLGTGIVAHGGQRILRMWAWERQHRTVWRLGAWLPAGSRELHVVTRMTSHADEEQTLVWRPCPGRPHEQLVSPGESVWWVDSLASDGGTLVHTSTPSLEVGQRDGDVAALALFADALAAPPRIIQQPDGWGRVEVEVGTIDDDPAAPFAGAELLPEHQAWLDFAVDGTLSQMQAKWPQTGQAWEQRLAAAVPGWERDLLVGHMEYAAGRPEAARARWASSLSHRVNGLALHCLAVTADDPWEAFDFASRAHETDPADDDLLIAYLTSDKIPPTVVLRVVDRLPQVRRSLPGVRRAETAALVTLGRDAEARALLEE